MNIYLLFADWISFGVFTVCILAYLLTFKSIYSRHRPVILVTTGINLAVMITNNPDMIPYFSLWATILLAVAAFIAIYANNQSAKRDRKRAVLDKVVDWVLELENVPLKTMIIRSPEELVMVNINTLIVYSSFTSSVRYIQPLLDEEFKTELSTELGNISKVLFKYFISFAKKSDIDQFDKLFDKESLADVEKQIVEKGESKVVEEYAAELSSLCNTFLKKAATVRVTL